MNGSRIFFWVCEFFEDFSSSLGLIWFCMDNVDESIELPGLTPTLQSCDAFSTLDLRWEACGLLSSYRQIFMQF